MKKDYHMNRHWAETLRLYSGLLESEQMSSFIKDLADKNILLASECRATSFIEDEPLDDYLTDIAVKIASNFDKAQSSARALIALTELNKFDEISSVFNVIKIGSEKPIYTKLISSYIRNANEQQISSFLIVIAESSSSLLNRALDIAFDQKIYFSNYSIDQAIKLCQILNDKPLLLAKVICLFQLRKQITDPNEILYQFLLNRQAKYAERFTSIIKFKASKEIGDFLKIYIAENEDRQSIESLLFVMNKTSIKIDSDFVRIELSKSLNPKVKLLALSTITKRLISDETAYRMCLENIKIGTKSSIEFVLYMMSMFNLSSKISIQQLIAALIENPKHQRLELAYKLIIENHLEKTFPIKLLYNKLLATLNYESLNLARTIVKSHFSDSDKDVELLKLCVLAQTKEKNQKLAREIATEDFKQFIGIEDLGLTIFTGFVSGCFNGQYKILFSKNNDQINLKRNSSISLRSRSIIRFIITELNGKISDSKIKIIESDILMPLKKELIFSPFFVGQIIDLQIKKVEDTRLYLINETYKTISFILKINEISQFFIKDLKLIFKVDDFLKLRINSFAKSKGYVYCSLKDIQFEGAIKMVEERAKFANNINLLKNKFAKK